MTHLWVIVQSSGPSTTDWIIAVSGVFAAIGTVGAVTVALWQVLKQNKPSLHVRTAERYSQAGKLVLLSATNIGPRPVRLTTARLKLTGFAVPVVAVALPDSTDLPVVLSEGETAEIWWDAAQLEPVATEKDTRYACAYFVDALGRMYEAPYPGMKRQRVGPPHRRRTVWVPQTSSRTPLIFRAGG